MIDVVHQFYIICEIDNHKSHKPERQITKNQCRKECNFIIDRCTKFQFNLLPVINKKRIGRKLSSTYRYNVTFSYIQNAKTLKILLK